MLFLFRWLRLHCEGDGRISRDRPGIGEHNGRLIVAGGSMDRNLTVIVEQFDTLYDTWSRYSKDCYNVHL